MKHFYLLLFCIIISGMLRAQEITIHHPQTVEVKLERISAPIRSLPQIPISEIEKGMKRKMKDNPSLEHPVPIVNQHALPVGEDPALQKIYDQHADQKMDTVANGITVLSNWEGLDSNVDPSDNNIAVGPNHVLQMTNGATATYIRIWDKSGNLLAPSTSVESITGSSDIGDPTVIYDAVADRYVFMVIRSFSGKLTLCVSQTNDPMDAWYVYSYHASGGLPDYPKIAVWGNSYFVTTNSNSPTIWAFNRDSLLAGAALDYAQKFALSSFPQIGFQSASPVTYTGNIQPPQGSSAIMIRVADDAWSTNIDSDHLELFKVNINWADSSLSSITGPINLNTIPYNSSVCGGFNQSCIPQPNSNTKLDMLGNIIMDKAQYRAFNNHEAIVCSHVVNKGDGKTGIRWYELRKDENTDWHIYQQGTYAPPDTNNRWMSSITINDEGTIALGYNISSKVTFPGFRVTGRGACDELNKMTMGETVIQDGSSQNGSYRYGDYNSVYTDPVDGSFWITGQYNPTTSWGTRVGHFTVPGCVATSIPAQSTTAEVLKIAPNPAADRIDVSVVCNGDESAPLRLIDLSGKVVLKKTIKLVRGSNISAIDLHAVEDGFYIVEVQTEEGVLLENVVIQR